MESKVEVRPAATDAELEAARDFAIAILDEAESRFPPSPRRGLAPDAPERWLAAARRSIAEDRGQVFVAVREGSVVGFLHVELHEQGPAYEMRHVARVKAVSVAEPFHGQGIAARMMHEAARWARARDISVMTLTTPFHNVAARYAWSSLGFEERALVMEKVLPDTLPPFGEEALEGPRVLHLPG